METRNRPVEGFAIAVGGEVIEIEFSYAQRYDAKGKERPTCVRFWPVVPRVGDNVEIEEFEIGGYVHHVAWLDRKDGGALEVSVVLK